MQITDVQMEEIEENKRSRLMPNPAYKTLLYYAIVITVIVLVNRLPEFKSGPCTPNLDFLLPVLAFLFSIVLLVTNGIRLITSGRAYLVSLIMHAVVIFVTIIALAFNS